MDYMNNNDLIIETGSIENMNDVQWYKIGFFYLFGTNTVSSGLMLVKENKFTSRINLRHVNETVTETGVSFNGVINHQLDLTRCSAATLKTLLQVSNLGNDARQVVNSVYNKKVHGDNNFTAPINITIPDRPTIIKKKIEAKKGVKFGFFWQKFILLPEMPFNINTIERKTFTTEVENVSANGQQNSSTRNVPAYYDIDYKVRIYDIKKFLGKFNNYFKKNGKKSLLFVLNDLAKDVENDINKFIQSHSFEESKRILTMSNSEGENEAYNIFGSSLQKVKDEYGIEIMEFKFNNFNRGQAIIDAEEKVDTAKKEGEATVITAEAENKKKMLENAATADYIEKMKQAGVPVESLAQVLAAGKGSKVVNVNTPDININHVKK